MTPKSFPLIAALAMFGGWSAGAAADSPSVVASIGPVHSLVAGVMEGVGTPDLIIAGGASPHVYALRPSEARALNSADVVFWIGPTLESALRRPIGALGDDATVVELMALDGLTLLDLRSHDHDHDHDHDHGHDHDDHHVADHGEIHDHGEGGIDPHIWLDPANAVVMVEAIAETLVSEDPDHGPVYRANADRMRRQLTALTDEVAAIVATVEDRPYIVFHDAYHYFENRFGTAFAGAVTLSPDIPAGAARLRDIRAMMDASGVVCVFREPQFEPRVIDAVIEGTGVAVGVLDPLGADLEPGPGLYPTLVRNLVDNLSDCLRPES